VSDTIERMTPAADILGRELNEQVRQLEQEFNRRRVAVQALLQHIGLGATCKRCGATEIYWVRQIMTTGRSAAYNPDGTLHACPTGNVLAAQRGERIY
jgi:hypothetical protein